MTDEEVCDFLGISRATLQRWLRNGPPKKRRARHVFDPRKVQHVFVGQSRRWNIQSLAKALSPSRKDR